jgi:C4-dicarboxylate-specific signal transduction histidine kinase
MALDLDALLPADDPATANARLARLAFALQVMDGLDDLAHDLRNPLHSLTMAVTLLAEDAARGEVQQAAGKLMEGATGRIERLIGGLDFPDFSEREVRPMALGELVARTLALWPLVRLTKGRPIEIDLPAALPAVQASDAALRTALLHLLQNACEAQAGSAGPAVRLAAEAHADRVVITVHDHGAGFAGGPRERHFAHGFTTKARDRHLGVGLGLARDLLGEIGGSLEVVALADAPGTVALLTLVAVA